MDGPPLTGAAHGASGVALALAEAAALLGTDRHRTVALDALRFERARYDPRLPGWPDLRPDADPGGTLAAWCHGSTGIGLARIAAARLVEDPGIAADLDLAVAAARQHYDGQQEGGRLTLTNLSLCHGEMGNLGFLATAARATGDRGLADRVHALTHAVASVVDRHGYICGVPNGLSNPGLLTGHAGIGYGMLRLLDPDQVPDVLTLAAGSAPGGVEPH